MNLGLTQTRIPFRAMLCAMRSGLQHAGAQLSIQPASAMAYATELGKYDQLLVLQVEYVQIYQWAP